MSDVYQAIDELRAKLTVDICAACEDAPAVEGSEFCAACQAEIDADGYYGDPKHEHGKGWS